MKRLLTTIVATAIAFGAYSQAHEKGKINIDMGAGIGIYKYDYTHVYQGVTISQVEDDTTGAWYAYLNAEYGVLDWFSAGLTYRKGSYYEDNDDASNSFHIVRLAGRFYFLNKDKFTFFSNIEYGLISMKDVGSGIVSSSVKYGGGDFAIGLGFKWYWTENIGMHLAYEYDSYTLNMKEYILGGQAQSLTDHSIMYDLGGSEIKIGISLKF